MSLCLLTGVSEESSSILHSTYATLALSISHSLWAGPRGVPAPPGPSLYDTRIVLRYGLDVNILLVYYQYMGKSISINGKRLQELRVERALSLRALGERSGVAYDTINKLELGRRPAHASTIRKLADALGVEPRELMKGEGHMNYVRLEVIRFAASVMHALEEHNVEHPEHPGVPLCNWQSDPSADPCFKPAEYLAPDPSRVSAGGGAGGGPPR